MAIALRRVLVGEPLPTSRAKHERLSKLVALPVFSSDALSSVAYGTEEILFALVAGGLLLSYSLYIGLAIALLLVVLTTSYRQTINAYPSGGGAYIVASDNLGMKAGTVAGAALLIDYVLTVSVSVASGVAAIDSAFPALRSHRVLICIFFIGLVALANLRGVRESGTLFSVPTYLFVVSFLLMIGVGIFRYLTGSAHPLPLPAEAHQVTGTLGIVGIFLFLKVILQAFASGCSALTGVEAISNGVPAFQAPEAKNAAATMTWMAVLLGSMFLGLTFLANVFHAFPTHSETVASQIARAVFGGRGIPYYIIQAATAMILVLAANTSFADFPRLSALLARDRLLPRQFAHIGDRLVFQNGILVLAGLASLLVILFKGDVHLLIPLYAVGVFLSFTLSQWGMVKRWRRLGNQWISRNVLVNGAGMIATAIVLAVIVEAKLMPHDGEVLLHLPFTLPLVGNTLRAGAWIVAILIPTLMLGFQHVHAHYQGMRRQLSVENWTRPQTAQHTVIVLVTGVHRGVIRALDFARLIAADCRALYVEVEHERTLEMYDRWEKWADGLPLVILESPYRSLTDPVIRYIDAVQAGDPNHIVTVVLPEFVPARWWHHLLHNQSALVLKLILLAKRNVIVTNIRYHLDE